jgi:hypothetical protein
LHTREALIVAAERLAVQPRRTVEWERLWAGSAFKIAPILLAAKQRPLHPDVEPHGFHMR